MVETFGTEKIGRAQIAALIDEHFDLRPGAFRETLKLHRPIYQKTAAYGHFGRDDEDFAWEQTDRLRPCARPPASPQWEGRHFPHESTRGNSSYGGGSRPPRPSCQAVGRA